MVIWNRFHLSTFGATDDFTALNAWLMGGHKIIVPFSGQVKIHETGAAAMPFCLNEPHHAVYLILRIHSA